jgi:uncharacterized protein
MTTLTKGFDFKEIAIKKRITKTDIYLLSVAMLAAISSGAIAKEQKPSSTPEFKEVSFPVSDADKRKILASEEVTIDGKTYPISYQTILRSGETLGKETFGLLVDQIGQPVKSKDGSVHISANNDFSSLLPVGGKLFMVSHFESRPGAMYVTDLNQDKKSGKLTAVSTKNIDFSCYGGLYSPCAGSVTPWNSHLGSEEYPNNARLTEAAESMDKIGDFDRPMARYFGVDPYAEETTVEYFRKVFKP